LITGGVRQGITLKDVIFTPAHMTKSKDAFEYMADYQIHGRPSDYMDIQRFGHCTVILDGLVVLYGGRLREGTFASTVKTLDPLTYQWNDVESLPKQSVKSIQRSHGSCTVHNNRAWICGGKQPTLYQEIGAGEAVASCRSFR